MAGIESMQRSQTPCFHGFDVFGTIPLIPLKPLQWARSPPIAPPTSLLRCLHIYQTIMYFINLQIEPPYLWVKIRSTRRNETWDISCLNERPHGKVEVFACLLVLADRLYCRSYPTPTNLINGIKYVPFKPLYSRSQTFWEWHKY